MDQPEPHAPHDFLPPLLSAFDTLMFISRHFHPPLFDEVMAGIGTPDADLSAARARNQDTLQKMGEAGQSLDVATDCALRAFQVLREAEGGAGDIRSVFRAFRFLPMGLEVLYPLAKSLASINQFFLDPALRSDTSLQALYASAPAQEKVGVMHLASDAAEGERGDVWLYVPEHYSPDRAWPLVVAMHGGSGNGHQFLWSWLRDARSRGVILAAPTSLGPTWALQGDDIDTPHLLSVLGILRANWNVDPARMLLTGMSDGGTFSYVSGLEPASPFTHLAPISAAFHPLMAEMCEPDRVRGLPIHIVHGSLDWMFPAAMAQAAARSLTRAGANVTYREIEDLSHTYPREMNAAILDWLGVSSPA
jgi:phospholipase/carboxylesterase